MRAEASWFSVRCVLFLLEDNFLEPSCSGSFLGWQRQPQRCTFSSTVAHWILFFLDTCLTWAHSVWMLATLEIWVCIPLNLLLASWDESIMLCEAWQHVTRKLVIPFLFFKFIANIYILLSTNVLRWNTDRLLFTLTDCKPEDAVQSEL